MRSIVYGWLSEDPFIADHVQDRIYPVNMQDVNPPRPYIVYRISSAVPRVVPAQNDTYQIWVHDDRGDYSLIDETLDRIKAILESKSGEGNFFEAIWLDDSPDLYDDGTNTITRYTRYDLVRMRS